MTREEEPEKLFYGEWYNALFFPILVLINAIIINFCGF